MAMKLAYLGPPGTFSEEAALKYNEKADLVPFYSVPAVAAAVETGLAEEGVVAIENSLEGSVTDTLDLLIHESKLLIRRELVLPIEHHLLAKPGTKALEIEAVFSHPQALAQCRRFLARNKLEPVRYHDTAGAARMVADKRPTGAAAIASAICAKLYDLEIIKEGIEDHERNLTRFLVLSKGEAREAGDKCSVLFSTAHKAGTLFRVLEVFAREGLNLTRIESVPEEPGAYAFFLDFMGSIQDPQVQKAVEEIKGITTRFKLLGCYLEKRVS